MIKIFKNSNIPILEKEYNLWESENSDIANITRKYSAVFSHCDVIHNVCVFYENKKVNKSSFTDHPSIFLTKVYDADVIEKFESGEYTGMWHAGLLIIKFEDCFSMEMKVTRFSSENLECKVLITEDNSIYITELI